MVANRLATYVNHYFTLSADTCARLFKMKPPFGYDGFGEIVFYRTYSRVKSDGSQESWADVVIRVINGTMSIRKDWYIKNSIEWDEEYWQKYASGMAIAMFRMEWLPAGRGMWAMGTPFVYEKGSMALNNCFAGETKFLADGKLQMLKHLVGQTVTVNGGRKAKVCSYGKQKLWNYVFKPAVGNSKYRQVHTATLSHRWLLSDGSSTTYLRAGDKVKINPGEIIPEGAEYDDGFIHGMIFADGCNHYKDNYYLQLCGWKEKFRDRLKQSKWYSHTITTGGRMIFESSVALKCLPSDESLQYKQGFLDGWRLFDGHWKKDSYCIDSINADAKQWLSDHSGILNYVMVGASVETADTNYGARSAPLNRLKLRFQPVEFIVDSKTPAGREEEVYCVEEPETNTFQLAGGIVTGNCGFTKLGGNSRLSDDLHWMMDALMLGVGVGFEPVRDDLKIYQPVGTYNHYVQDSREGWADSLKLLVDAYTKPGCRKPVFRFDLVRRKGLPIRGFGGLASGPAPLKRLLEQVETLFETPGIDVVRLKADIANMIGVCVVAGNVRRSAELAKGSVQDPIFLDLKDYEKYPERDDWGYMSNNSVALFEDADFESLGEVARRVIVRGEPGVLNLRNFKYGRIGKPIPVREDLADGLNPCGEIPLEDKELCNVVETLPTMCPSPERWYQACEYATTYASSVSLLPTHRQETNRVVVRNRRIGVSIIDWTGWIHRESMHRVTAYMRKGYEVVTRTNKERNSEAGVPEAIRKTTINKMVA